MKLPLKVEYACRVLVQLESTFGSGNVRRIDDLAAEEKISANYLVQILNELRNAGLVESRRGKNGGYQLARDPAAVTLGDIVNALEGQLLHLNSSGEGASGTHVTGIWEEVFTAINRELAKHTLADIAQRGAAQMWHI
ncbi:MAG: Rrf2 family cysteine metabolism transcriptional repressor [Verrucomicrobiales bacterium]